MAERLTKEVFAPCLNQSFRVRLPSGENLALELVEVTAKRSAKRPPQMRQEPFSILFRGPAETILSQGTYCVEHDQVGSLEIFIVPVSRDSHGMYYEAVFN